jgi:transposase-like protein
MRKYDEDYKREAVRKFHDGQSVASVARELGVAESLLHNWKRQAVEMSSGSEREVIALAQEVARCRDGARHIKKGGAYHRL